MIITISTVCFLKQKHEMEKLENHMFAQMCLFAAHSIRESSWLVFDFQYIATDTVFVGFDNNGCN